MPEHLKPLNFTCNSSNSSSSSWNVCSSSGTLVGWWADGGFGIGGLALKDGFFILKYPKNSGSLNDNFLRGLVPPGVTGSGVPGLWPPLDTSAPIVSFPGFLNIFTQAAFLLLITRSPANRGWPWSSGTRDADAHSRPHYPHKWSRLVLWTKVVCRRFHGLLTNISILINLLDPNKYIIHMKWSD